MNGSTKKHEDKNLQKSNKNKTTQNLVTQWFWVVLFVTVCLRVLEDSSYQADSEGGVDRNLAEQFEFLAAVPIFEV